jgi:hypothetical protein
MDLPPGSRAGAAGLNTHNQLCSPLRKEVSRVKAKKPNDPKVKRMNINVEVSLHDAFKAATAAKGENMTDVLMQFIQQYVEKYGFEPKKKGQR